MKFKSFVVYDEKARAYLPPFFLPEVAQAVRTFGDCCGDVSHEFGKHPEDYSLFQVGVFDSSSGVFEVSQTLLFVINGLEVRAAVQRVAEQLALRMSKVEERVA